MKMLRTTTVASLLALALALAAMPARAQNAIDPDEPNGAAAEVRRPPPFRPWQEVWQCRDLRVTVIGREPYGIEYDIGGTLFGGGQFAVARGQLFFNATPCVQLATYQ
jgi:hypothetical protein